MADHGYPIDKDNTKSSEARPTCSQEQFQGMTGAVNGAGALRQAAIQGALADGKVSTSWVHSPALTPRSAASNAAIPPFRNPGLLQVASFGAQQPSVQDCNGSLQSQSSTYLTAIPSNLQSESMGTVSDLILSSETPEQPQQQKNHEALKSTAQATRQPSPLAKTLAPALEIIPQTEEVEPSCSHQKPTGALADDFTPKPPVLVSKLQESVTSLSTVDNEASEILTTLKHGLFCTELSETVSELPVASANPATSLQSALAREEEDSDDEMVVELLKSGNLRVELPPESKHWTTIQELKYPSYGTHYLQGDTHRGIGSPYSYFYPDQAGACLPTSNIAPSSKRLGKHHLPSAIRKQRRSGKELSVEAEGDNSVYDKVYRPRASTSRRASSEQEEDMMRDLEGIERRSATISGQRRQSTDLKYSVGCEPGGTFRCLRCGKRGFQKALAVRSHLSHCPGTANMRSLRAQIESGVLPSDAKLTLGIDGQDQGAVPAWVPAFSNVASKSRNLNEETMGTLGPQPSTGSDVPEPSVDVAHAAASAAIAGEPKSGEGRDTDTHTQPQLGHFLAYRALNSPNHPDSEQGSIPGLGDRGRSGSITGDWEDAYNARRRSTRTSASPMMGLEIAPDMGTGANAFFTRYDSVLSRRTGKRKGDALGDEPPSKMAALESPLDHTTTPAAIPMSHNAPWTTTYGPHGPSTLQPSSHQYQAFPISSSLSSASPSGAHIHIHQVPQASGSYHTVAYPCRHCGIAFYNKQALGWHTRKGCPVLH